MADIDLDMAWQAVRAICKSRRAPLLRSFGPPARARRRVDRMGALARQLSSAQGFIHSLRNLMEGGAAALAIRSDVLFYALCMVHGTVFKNNACYWLNGQSLVGSTFIEQQCCLHKDLTLAGDAQGFGEGE